jgi:DNA-directed RNA polymerase subunit RPC12/RpoP
MQAAFKTALGLAMVLGLVLAVSAAEDKEGKKEEGKEVTLKGEIGCPKCGFKIAKKCGNAIKVKDGEKEVIYTLIDEGAKAPYHSEICTEIKKGSVTGVVSTKGKDKFIKPAKDGVKFE